MASKSVRTQPKQSENLEYVPIKVTAGILLHIGSGIYHSLAGALKELVNNSYDADAREVAISTDYPRFDEFTVVDNGSGMSADRFKQAMSIIGSSLKSLVDTRRITPIYKRPIIGQLGIGFMALSQVCSKAIVESQEEGAETKFVAVIDFSQFKKRESEQVNSSKVQVLRDQYGDDSELDRRLKDPKTSRLVKSELKIIKELLNKAEAVRGQEEDLETEHLGYCVLRRNLPATPGKKGTTITLQQIDETVKDILKDQGKSIHLLPKSRGKNATWESHRSEVNKWNWEELCTRLREETNGLTYQALPNYHQFLWELSVMTPITYFDKAPVTLRPQLLSKKKAKLDSYRFSLVVDNRILQKPVLLPSGSLVRSDDELRAKYDYNIKSFHADRMVDGNRLQYEGYLYWQRNQVQPSALRGLEIFIRNVGIGAYDYTLMGFPTVNLTSRAGQVSGEVYVDHGLETALNIDRNSFKETHEHYIALQRHVWDLLGSLHRGHGLFGDSITSYDLRRADKDAETEVQHVSEMRQLVEFASKGKLSLAFHNTGGDSAFEIRAGKLVVHNESRRWPKAKQEKRLCQRILICAVAALRSGESPREVMKILESALLRD